ncbi:protein DA1-related 1-like [Rosa chinensis]|nr:protein DA1-related 1-like [Rosa chinensis]
MPLIQNVREFYRSLNLVVDETIPFLLVDKDMMLKFIPGRETIGTIWNKDSSLRACTTINKCSTREGIIKVEKHTERLTRRCNLLTLRRKSSVKALIILFGSPGVRMGETMAHEMMHAWFYLQGCRGKLERSVEEGICSLMGYMWMEWFCTSGVDSFYKTSVQVQYTKDLKDYTAHCMELNQDKIYGQGFRDAIKAVSKFGFNYTVDYIVKNKCLPCEMDPAPLQCRGCAVM